MNTESQLIKAAQTGDFQAAENAGWKLTWEPPELELGHCIFEAAKQGNAEFITKLRKHGSAQLNSSRSTKDRFRAALDIALSHAAGHRSSKPLELLLTQFKMPSDAEAANSLFTSAAGYGRFKNLKTLVQHVSREHLTECCRSGAMRALSRGFLKSALYLTGVLVESGAYSDETTAWIDIDNRERNRCLGIAARSRRLHILTWALAQGFQNKGDCLGEAASMNWLEGVRLLLSRGIDLKASPSEALIHAARQDNVEMAKTLINAGATTRKTYGAKTPTFLQSTLSPLLQAAFEGSVHVMELLLNLPEPDVPETREMQEALKYAIERSHVEAARMLRSALGPQEMPATVKGNIVVAAAESGKQELWQDAIRDGLDPHIRNDDGNTPLHGACWAGNAEIVRQLLKAGASPQELNESDQTPLHLAVRHHPDWNYGPDRNPAEVIRLLLEAGADIDAVCGGRTPLAEALWGGREEEVRLLLELGADVMGKIDPAQPEETPLHVAVIQRDPTTIALLISAGADVNAADSMGWTPLHWAARHDAINPENLGELLRNGADPNRRCHNGKTPLHVAAGDTRIDAVEQLLAAGADSNVQDNEGNTPLITLCLEPFLHWNAAQIATMLLEAGADPNHRNRNRRTARHYAVKHKTELKEVLLILDQQKVPK